MSNSIHNFSQEKLTNLSFFKDSIHIAHQIQVQSSALKTLNHLETWLSNSSALDHNYLVEQNPTDKTLWILTPNTDPQVNASLSPKTKAILGILKTLATVTVIPRLIAELVRFGLRQFLQLKLSSESINPNAFMSTDHEEFSTTKHSPIHDYAQLLTNVDPNNSSTYLEGMKYYSSKNSLMCVEAKQFPGLIFKTIQGNIETASDTYKEAAIVLYTTHRNLKKLQQIVQENEFLSTYIHIPHSRYYDQENSRPFLLQEKVPIDHSVSANNMWEDNENSASLIFCALAQLIFEKGVEFSDPTQFTLYQGSSNPVGSIIGRVKFIEHNSRDNQLKQIKKLFSYLSDPECMNLIIKTLVNIEKTIDDNIAALLENSLRDLKEARLGEIAKNTST
ncbi:hypothetical protein CLAVI_000395 [Candidatus Clavichlamydia salmonicola]|uniref:hypothetical protein n=1 Tax=Candidatus Clavichlamydia salmonicola TaxID=469812 RepID=UPI00189146C3|nr:hypothetical protein [Candidatus Clavichlamydia salmonicola]MBF5050776.1 hypothetical protein [Candidatus Clavichlamydia salmonicola]